jgi:ectoine hydroxylase-related dioxygenase (phytanoyl-CoA dioxygenase family)
MHKIVKYDIKKYPFIDIVTKWLDCDLSKTHIHYSLNDQIKGIGSDTMSSPHKTFYSNMDNNSESFASLYKSFIKDVLFPQINQECYYQTFPGFRIASPDNVAVSTWHADGDEENLHPPGEINIFLPLTNCYGNNSMWIESEPGKKDFHPVKLSKGEVYIFDGNKCVHGNYRNDTMDTRISFDFRLMPKDKYDPNYPHVTATKKLSYTIGGYYQKI